MEKRDDRRPYAFDIGDDNEEEKEDEKVKFDLFSPPETEPEENGEDEPEGIADLIYGAELEGLYSGEIFEEAIQNLNSAKKYFAKDEIDGTEYYAKTKNRIFEFRIRRHKFDRWTLWVRFPKKNAASIFDNDAKELYYNSPRGEECFRTIRKYIEKYLKY